MNLPPLLNKVRARLFVFLVVNGLAQAAVAIATVLLAKFAIDRLAAAQDPAPTRLFVVIGIGMTAAALAMAWLRIRERVDAQRLGQDYTSCIRLALFDRLTSMDPRTMQRHGRGSVLLRFVSDLTAIRQWVSIGLARLAVAGVTTCAVLSILASIEWVFAAVVGGVLAAGAVVSLVSGRRMQLIVREARRRRSRLATNVSEKLTSMAVVQLFGQSNREREHVARQSERLKSAMVDRARAIGRLRAIAEATVSAATGCVLLVGAAEVSAGRATSGTLVSGLVIVGLLAPRLRDLGRTHEYWHGAKVSLDKIAGFLATPSPLESAVGAPSLHAESGHLVFEGVSVAGSLDKIWAETKSGSIVAVVGPNGAGKSTLLSLAARLLDPDEGRVLVDGQDLRQCDLGSIRRAVGMAGPDLPLLRGTVKKNLLYRFRNAPSDEVRRVATLCGVDKILAELPDGVRTRVTEGGSNFSTGQRQCLALARALLGNPLLLLLDEVDANLDPHARIALDRILNEYQGTVVMTTHRVDRVLQADVVWHLHRGRLIEAGAPLELLNRAGPTAELFGRDLIRAS